MALSVVHTLLLLALWLSLWYTTIFYWPTGPPYVRLLSSPDHVAQSYGKLPFSTGPLAVSVVHYYLLLAYCLSLWYTLIFLCPTGLSYCTQLSSTVLLPPHVSVVHYYLLLVHWLSLWYTTIFYWPTGYPNGTLPSPISLLAIPMIYYYLRLVHWISKLYTTSISVLHYYLLLAHRISQWYTTLFYWPAVYLYGTLPFPIGSLAIPMLHCYLPLAH